MPVLDAVFRMRNVAILLAGLGTAAPAAESSSVDPARQARAFLLRYVSLTSTADVAALDLYHDDARVRVASYLGAQQTQASIVRGAEWKRQLRAGWYDGTARLEAASFQGAEVLRNGERLVIHARRYSQPHCYWDNGYAVVIAPDRFGQFQILEERISFQRASSCRASAPALAAASPSIAAPLHRPPGGIDSLPPVVSPTVKPAGLPRNPVPVGQGALRPTPQAQPAPAVSVQP